jgi:predicted transposase YbfD/YdcC
LHLVSAWATEHGLVVGQVATDAKSNEITAIPALLKLLALEGATVTIDALGCQTAIAAQIVEQGADYVLALKDNHEHLHERARLAFVDADAATGTTLPLADLAAHTTVEKDHGRIERRRCRAIGDADYLAFIDPDGAWPNLRSVVCIESTRRIGDAVSTEARHYLSSLPADAQLLQRVIRSHWGVENRLHWVLDLAFHEDRSRVRTDHAPENLAIIRHLALNLLRRDPNRRIGLKNARFKAALNDAYLRSILDGVRA